MKKEKVARNFQSVSNGIIKIIEEECSFSEYKTVEIIEQIEKVKKSNCYKAPELQYISWNELASILGIYFVPENSSWEEKIRQLFADEIDLDSL